MKQFSKSDAKATADIARTRVHVERIIQSIKLFQILNDRMKWYLLPQIDNIMTVVATLVKLSSPILGDDKFEYIPVMDS